MSLQRRNTKPREKGKCQHTKKIHQRHYNNSQNSVFFFLPPFASVRISSFLPDAGKRVSGGRFVVLSGASHPLSVSSSPLFSHSYHTNLCFAISWSYHLASAGHTGETLQKWAEIWRNPLTDAALLPRPLKWSSSLTPPCEPLLISPLSSRPSQSSALISTASRSPSLP